jgi:predicted RNA-binding protein
MKHYKLTALNVTNGQHTISHRTILTRETVIDPESVLVVEVPSWVHFDQVREFKDMLKKTLPYREIIVAAASIKVFRLEEISETDTDAFERTRRMLTERDTPKGQAQ